MVLVIGESLIDRITRADGTVEDVLGGGPFNAARALASLGCDTTFVGGISDDSFGEQISTQLAQVGVAVALPRVPHSTGIAHVTLDETGSARYRFELENSACAQVRSTDIDAVLREGNFAAVHVGTLGLVLQPLADAVTALIEQIDANVLCFVDPNCRPALVSDRDSYLRRLHTVLTRADVVKVSTEDVAFIRPGVSSEVVAKQLLEGQPKVVLLTRGADGVEVFTGDGVLSIPAARTQVVDTVGAGDVFGAAWLAYWLRQRWARDDLADAAKVVQAARYGVAAAAWTVAQVGAKAPTLEDLEANPYA